jgi:hypothetical protein
MTKGSDNPFPSTLFEEQGSVPATPSAGFWRLYLKSDGLYIVDDAGVETGPFITSAGGGYTEGARVYNSSNISVAHAALTALTFDSERYDTDSIHSTVSNTSRLTCQTDGKYLISANIHFASSAAGTSRAIIIELNGSGTYIAFDSRRPVSGDATRLSISTIYDLSAGNYVQLIPYQDSSGSLNVLASGNYSPEFMMQRIG